MACECIDRVNEALKPHNARLALTFTVGVKDGKPGGTYPTIMTEVIEKKRGARAPGAIPTFCPFCGNRYEPGDA